VNTVKHVLKVISRVGLVAVLLLAWIAPAAYATETTCEETETGWLCTVWVNTFGEGPQFTFTLSEETDIVAKTFTSMTCADWETAPHAYAADPHLWLYSVDAEGVLSLLMDDDDGHIEVNDGANMCWDSKIETTLSPGDYSLRADAFDTDYIGTYTLEFVNVSIAVPSPTPTPEPDPTPIPEPTPLPDPTPTPLPEPTPIPQPTPEPTPIEDPPPVEEPEPTLPPLPEPSPTPLPQPPPPPVTIIPVEPITEEEVADILEDYFTDPDIEWNYDWDFSDVIIDDLSPGDDPENDPGDDDFSPGEIEISEELPEIEEVDDEFSRFEEFDPGNDSENDPEIDNLPGEFIELEEEEEFELIDPEEFIEEFEEGPPNEEDIYFDEATGEWEDDPDLELEEVDIEDLLESEEALDELIEELEADDVLEEILEDNPDFIEAAEDEQLEQLFEEKPEIFNQADTEIKEEFQEEVNVFSGAFDDYVASGQNITVEERRTVVAATAVVSAVAIQARPTMTGPTPGISGPASGPASGPSSRTRGRNNR
jgi:hypothetical protein